mgnify:CR=1 FL=1
MKEQVEKYLSGNEAAALAVKQIGYDIMGYYPITPSTQIAENLDLMGAKGEVDITMIPAEGEHSAAGICYGASAAGARAFNATSANGLLYALEQFPVQSGTRYPMVMNVACRTVSGPLSIKGDHSDIMFMLNTGWIILFAHSVQQVYDFNIIATKLGESVSLPVVVAYDGFFTSHQKKRSYSFKSDEDVKNFVGKKKEKHDLLDLENPITIGSYMNEPDLINNRFQLYEAVTLAGKRLDEIFKSYENLSQRHYEMVEEYKVKDAEIVMILLGSAFDTVTVAVDKLRKEGIKAGVITLNVIRPFPIDEVVKRVKDKCKILVADRQDSYGANGGNLSLEVRAAFQRRKKNVEIKSVVYGLGGIDFDVSDGRWLLEQYDNLPDFSYYGVTKGGKEKVQDNLLKKIDKERTHYGNALQTVIAKLSTCSEDERQALLEKKSEYESQLMDLDKAKQEVDYREANQKAGYVYIISNIGAFGENVYKIGMTRRLEPMDRIDELGDASVPFDFDVHALIFSDDAPALEAALHKAFDTRKVNMINQRREFFRVSLDEIEAVVKKNYDKTVEFIRIPPAEQFRMTQKIIAEESL